MTLEYHEGSRVPVLAGEAWRVEPGPPTRIAAGELVASGAVAVEPAIERGLGWCADVIALVSPRGLAYGLTIAAPPVRVLGLQLELVAGGGLGSGGAHGAALLVGRL